MNKNNALLFLNIKNLNLAIGHYAITGSGPLGVRNLRKIGDIDIIVDSDLWHELSEKYDVVNENNVEKIVLENGIEAFWEHSFYTIKKDKDQPTVAERIQKAEIIDGLPFESLEYVIYYKRKMGREKDLQDIHLIEAWQKTQSL